MLFVGETGAFERGNPVQLFLCLSLDCLDVVLVNYFILASAVKLFNLLNCRVVFLLEKGRGVALDLPRCPQLAVQLYILQSHTEVKGARRAAKEARLLQLTEPLIDTRLPVLN